MDAITLTAGIVFVVICFAASWITGWTAYLLGREERILVNRFLKILKRKGGRKMTIPKRLSQFLKRNKIYYQIEVHPKTITSSETAQAEHISGRQFAKTVMAKVKGRDVMLVLPASHTVDLFKLSTVLETSDVRIEKESDFEELFPDCEPGAMPPIGRLYHIPCYVDKSLGEQSSIYFHAGTHTESVKVDTSDFLRGVKAEILDFAVLGKKVAA